MAKKIEDTITIVSNVVVKKRGRKSKKEIELAQQNEIQSQTQIQDNINVIIEETDILLPNDDIIENLINSDDDENELTKDNLLNLETKLSQKNEDENLIEEKLFNKLLQLIIIKKQNQMLFYT